MFNIFKNHFKSNKGKKEFYKIKDYYKEYDDDDDDDDLKEGTINIIKDDNVVLFVKNLFTFLKKYKMCFLSGTIIFQDNNNELFNFLTFNNIKNDNCNGKVEATSGHYTLTHKEVYKNNKVESAETCVEKFLDPLNKKLEEFSCNNKTPHSCFKMEYVLNNKIHFLCDQETMGNKINPKNSSTKRVILYYRFKIVDKTYLFFKLEAYSMLKSGHIVEFINKKRFDTYLKRRENENNYINELYEIDMDFYDKSVEFLNKADEENTKRIKYDIIYYNENLRTGRELFIYEDLKKFLLYYKAVQLDEVKISV
jgi:hypothetical protein